MNNDRPIDDPNLQEALNLFKAIMAKYGFAGACMLIGPKEAAFAYGLHAPWSAIQPDAFAPLGFRIRSKPGEADKHARLVGAVHTICQLSDFGAQTMDWCEQLKALLRQTGLEFDHVPFGGQPLPSLGLGE